MPRGRRQVVLSALWKPQVRQTLGMVTGHGAALSVMTAALHLHHLAQQSLATAERQCVRASGFTLEFHSN